MFVKRSDVPPAPPGPPRPPHWQVASLRARLAAWAIDTALVIGFTVVLCLPTRELSERAGPFSDQAGWIATTTAASTTTDLLITALETGVMWIAWTLYLGAMTARRGAENGQTIGKAALGLRVRLVDGSAVPAGTAWRRALAIPAILSAPNLIAALLDAALGTQPTFLDGADLLEYLVIVALIALALRGGFRQALYDERLGTVVVASRPIGGPGGAPIVRSAAAGTEAAERFPVEARRSTASTWLLAALTAAALVGSMVSVLWPGWLD